MTDTTDTASLKKQIDTAADIIRDLTDKLEAERQRAAGSEEELHKALHREKAAERKLLAVQEEIAALKSAHGNMVSRCALLRQRTDLPVDRIPAYNTLVKAQEEVKELRDKLANPVVLPKYAGDLNHGNAFLRGVEATANKIRAAGFTVKGEI